MAERERLRRRLDDGLAALDLDLSDAVRDRLIAYVELLARWNAAYNLTAVRDPGEMVARHLLDSLAIAPHVSGTTLADLGSGAGLPGIPLALVAPERQVTLVDSNGKKARFLREAVRALKLANVRVIEGRVQDVPGQFDCVTARAFATLADMLNWAGGLLADGGNWLAMKGKVDEAEIAAVPAGFRVERIVTLQVPATVGERHLIVVRKA
ncbi:MAG: 16S rRNA (guanine(527)-N(7))-methyltransferase RsmG [Lysobacterales bacterium 69-70]|nr:16S rRNA (guanine(527)-N(7))-methyltransferase RsmG [Xanthomonadaceae bacterium]ODU35508.1 MAG: 16S rRNA (guanine(527)-N(7))-methyltransferase [Xanthomonadaceae bacterium SCN 69-320]ODV16754.1 MAG: 16S rRNA (guanine(527)-N(7))-methyltransferase [Xanthomonadaceae bacterium SCN 69-25]OJY96651.1 MAG: 16S rRNA (guanine(527)-N(7))-methyltransferase RsmG [Xanthomonadales bacterium 69-70]